MKKKLIDSFWTYLKNIQSLLISAESLRIGKTTTQSGTAIVQTVLETPNQIIFKEKGTWTSGPFEGNNFSNTFRWTYKKTQIGLEHLRYGETHPVFLFDLSPNDTGFKSVCPHLCGDDQYSGQIDSSPQGFNLIIYVKGKAKNDRMVYQYFQ